MPALHITTAQLPAILTMAVAHFNWVPLIQGAPGVGKTAMIEAWARDNGYAPTVELLSMADPLMFRGLQGIDNTGEEPKTIDCVPAVIQKVRDLRAKAKKPVLLFLDELTLAPPMMQGAALTFIQDRHINGVYLPDDTRIIAAGNSADDSPAVHALTGPAQSRVVHYTLEPSFKQWQQYAIGKNISPLLIGALESHSDFFYTDNAVDCTGPFPCPRQWDKVGAVLEYADDTGLAYASDAVRSTVNGLVGDAAASAVLATIELADGIPTPGAILKNPDKCIVPKVGDSRRNYLVTSLCLSMLARADDKVDRKALSTAIATYVGRLQTSHIISFVTACTKVPGAGWFTAMQAKFVTQYVKDIVSVHDN